jgi:uncharacterized protein (DUF1501 family)
MSKRSTRRGFLQQSALVALTPLVPRFVSLSAQAAEVQADDRGLVVIQLDGGNDGLNTVIPFADENYARFRRELRIKRDDVLKLNDAVGLHPAMKAAADLYSDGRLTIVQGVGYPNPNRSHFESMAIWNHARLAADEHDGDGWLGRAAEKLRRNPATADSIYVGSETVPVALQGRRANALALQSEADLQLAIENNPRRSRQPATDVAAFVERSLDQSFAAARQFRESAEAKASTTDGYPGTPLAEKLKLVARLMMLGGGTRIYYVSQPGYDTHAAQLYPHEQLLREFAGALKAFLNHLQQIRLAERTVVLAFSEFGRRVDENGSAGTDHGAAGPVFLAGGGVRGGIVGEHPSLTDLEGLNPDQVNPNQVNRNQVNPDQGDLKMALDFRQVYATLLTGWLGVDSQAVLGQNLAALPLFGS